MVIMIIMASSADFGGVGGKSYFESAFWVAKHPGIKNMTFTKPAHCSEGQM